MGASNGGVALKIDTSKIELLKTVKDLFGHDFEKSETFCDSRNNDCVYIGKTKDFLIIVNSDFADKFFENQQSESISQYFEYFSKPDFIFAFEEYDSGGTYSYSIIYNGAVKRQFRSLSHETKTDFGELELSELKWKNAETTEQDLGDGDFEIIYKDPTRDFSCSKEQLPQIILQELMYEKLGFASWNMDEFMTEQGHFKRMKAPNVEQVNQEKKPIITEKEKKPWWKF